MNGTGSSIGWDYIAPRARANGFNDAHLMFDDVPPEFLDPPPQTFKSLLLGEIRALPKPREFVEGLLCVKESSVIYGDSNVGKSFFTLDLGLHVALGWRWRDREVEQGGVLYIAGEGVSGLSNRLEAFQQKHGAENVAGAAFAVVPTMPNFRSEKEIAGLIETIRETGDRLGTPIRWVIADTLNRALCGGNENASEDMGAIVRAVDRIVQATGAHVSLIHHSGKDSTKGARGHSSLRGAVTTEIRIAPSTECEEIILATCPKQRDRERGDALAFRLRPTRVGTNQWDKPVTSCVVEAAALPVNLPHAFREPSAGEVEQIQEAVRAGDYRADVRARNWVGEPIAGAMGLSAKAEVKAVYDYLVRTGALKTVTRTDAHREPKEFVEVGKKWEAEKW
jgi:hypothetical protein